MAPGKFGFVFRTIKSDVTVYRDETTHQVTYLNDSFDLRNWGCVQLRGTDAYKLNRMLAPPEYELEISGVPSLS